MFSRQRWSMSLLALPIILVIVVFRSPAPVIAPPAPPTATLAAVPSRVVAPPTPAVVALPQMIAVPATATSIPTPSVEPTPTPRRGVPLRVGIQAGHWRASELPDELARLRNSSGAIADGHTESDITLDIARRVAGLLQSRGIIVDVLPATIPPAYDADAFVTLHADGSPSSSKRGFKMTTPWRTSRASQHLLDALVAEYVSGTGLPQDGAITMNMRGYYAFNYRRHTHAIAKTTPAVIIEMGFLTSPDDRMVLVNQPDSAAIGIANGIVRYLNERDPLDGAALLPPSYVVQRPANPEGIELRAAPRDDAESIGHVAANQRLFPFQDQDGWYQAIVVGNWELIGWVRERDVVATQDPLPTPTNDS